MRRGKATGFDVKDLRGKMLCLEQKKNRLYGVIFTLKADLFQHSRCSLIQNYLIMSAESIAAAN